MPLEVQVGCFNGKQVMGKEQALHDLDVVSVMVMPCSAQYKYMENDLPHQRFWSDSFEGL